jgi:hypothetical protein
VRATARRLGRGASRRWHGRSGGARVGAGVRLGGSAQARGRRGAGAAGGCGTSEQRVRGGAERAQVLAALAVARAVAGQGVRARLQAAGAATCGGAGASRARMRGARKLAALEQVARASDGAHVKVLKI